MAVITPSDIQGSFEAISGNDCAEGKIDANPYFADMDNGDFHLLPDSPCIDAGNNDVLNLPSRDFEGDDRILDGDEDGMAFVDMGVDGVAVNWSYFYLPVVLKDY